MSSSRGARRSCALEREQDRRRQLVVVVLRERGDERRRRQRIDDEQPVLAVRERELGAMHDLVDLARVRARTALT